MQTRKVIVLLAVVGTVLGVGWGCSSSTQLDPNRLAELSTLTVRYRTPGPTASPCDDITPVLDGLATQQEWGDAEPLFVNLRGADGSGGADYTVEVRALYSDELSQTGQGQNRLYLMIRYADDDLDRNADLYVYGKPDPLIPGRVNPSPVPLSSPGNCDTVATVPENWIVQNPGGAEDQVAVLLINATSNPNTDLVETNRQVLRELGQGPPNTTVSGATDTDVWIWRSGRTNDHPVAQFAKWDLYSPITEVPSEGILDLPELAFSRFDPTCGFAEDLYIGTGGAFATDAGRNSFIRNREDRTGDRPFRITQPPRFGRGEEQVGDTFVRNANLPLDLTLWWPASKRFSGCDSIATSRIGVPDKWSHNLSFGSIDIMRGWGIQTPTLSQKDVRGAGGYEIPADNGFGIWSIELMRDFDTGATDDVLIDPATGEYHIVIGIYDNSGRVASGTRTIRLQFQNPEDQDSPGRRC